MKVILRDHVLGHLLNPCIETYLEKLRAKKESTEFIANIHGFYDRNNAVFLIEDVYSRITPERSKEHVDLLDENVQRKLDKNLEGIVIAPRIGDVHSHIGGIDGDWLEATQKVRSYQGFIRQFGKSTMPGEYDFKTMNKRQDKIYLIIGMMEDNRYMIDWQYATDRKSIIGTTKDYAFCITAWHYNRRRRKFTKAKVECNLVLGMKGK